MKKTKWLLAVLGIGILTLTLMAACGKSSDGGRGSNGSSDGRQAVAENRTLGGISLGEHRMIANVNGEDIFEDDYMEWYMQTMALSLGLDMTEEIDEQYAGIIEAYKYSYLVGYTEQFAILQEANRLRIAVGDDEVEDYRLMLVEDMAGDEEAFAMILERWGFNDVTLRNYLKEQMTIELLYEEKTKSVSEPDMTPEEYYNAHPEEFRVNETRSVRHILVDEEEEADEIIASLGAGADFDELVMSRSTDPGALYNGGAYGPFDVYGRMSDGSAFIEEFALASFTLDAVGDITQEPVPSQYGFHIIVLDEILPPHTVPFAEVRDALAYELLMEAKESYFDAFCRGLMDAAEIVYADYVAEE